MYMKFCPIYWYVEQNAMGPHVFFFLPRCWGKLHLYFKLQLTMFMWFCGNSFLIRYVHFFSESEVMHCRWFTCKICNENFLFSFFFLLALITLLKGIFTFLSCVHLGKLCQIVISSISMCGVFINPIIAF